jgi:hypothetical protein
MDNRFWDPTTSDSVTSCSIIMGLGRSEERPVNEMTRTTTNFPQNPRKAPK